MLQYAFRSDSATKPDPPIWFKSDWTCPAEWRPSCYRVSKAYVYKYEMRDIESNTFSWHYESSCIHVTTSFISNMSSYVIQDNSSVKHLHNRDQWSTATTHVTAHTPQGANFKYYCPITWRQWTSNHDVSVYRWSSTSRSTISDTEEWRPSHMDKS